MITVQKSGLRMGIAAEKRVKPEAVSEEMIYLRLRDIAAFRGATITLMDGRKPLYKVRSGGDIEEFLVPEFLTNMTDLLAGMIIEGGVNRSDRVQAGAAAFASRYILNGPINVEKRG